MPPLPHLTSSTPTKSNLYLANSLPAAVSEPALYRLLTFQVPNLYVSSPSLRSYQGICPGTRHMYTFCNIVVLLRWGVFSTSPNPQAGGPPSFRCPLLHIQYIRRYPPLWRLFLHPQSEDAPWRGGRYPLALCCASYTSSFVTDVKCQKECLCVACLLLSAFHCNYAFLNVRGGVSTCKRWYIHVPKNLGKSDDSSLLPIPLG